MVKITQMIRLSSAVLAIFLIAPICAAQKKKVEKKVAPAKKKVAAAKKSVAPVAPKVAPVAGTVSNMIIKLGDNFPKADASGKLDLSRTALNAISGFSAQFPNGITDLSGLQTIPGKETITSLDLSGNSIASISKGTFAGFAALTTLDLRKNPINTGIIIKTVGALTGMPKLDSLYMEVDPNTNEPTLNTNLFDARQWGSQWLSFKLNPLDGTGINFGWVDTN